MILRYCLVFIFSTGIVFSQEAKRSVSSGFGKKSVQNKTILYSIGQSSVIGNYSLGEANILKGFLSPVINPEIKESVNDLEVFPNPFLNHFVVKYDLPCNPSIALFDLNGQKIDISINKKSNSEFEITDVEYLPAANYILISEFNGIKNFKLLLLEK